MNAREGMMAKVRGLLTSASVSHRSRIEDVLLGTLRLPLVRAAYDKAYFDFRILRRAEQAPRVMSVETYNVCNLRCVMCPYPLMTRPKTFMSLELTKKIVDDAVQAKVRTICFSLYSEPLLDKLLFDRIAYAKAAGLEVGIFTNATMLTHEHAEKLVSCRLDWMTISFDGASKATYEAIRLGADFDIAVANVRHMLEVRRAKTSQTPHVKINCAVQRGNHAEITSHAGRMYDLFQGADRFAFSIVDSRKDPSVLPASGARKGRSRLPYPCPRLWDELVVLSSGKVVLCCLDYDGSTELGDLNHQTVQEVWLSERFSQVRTLHLSRKGTDIGLCSKCWMPRRGSAYLWWRL